MGKIILILIENSITDDKLTHNDNSNMNNNGWELWLVSVVTSVKSLRAFNV